MTENEAKIFIQNAMEQSKNVLAELMLIMPKVFAAKRKNLGEYYSNLENCKKEIQSCEVAIKALEEVQQYRALETRLADMFGGELSLEDVTDELERQLKEPDNPHPINAKILTYEEAEDWDAYRAIGTPEECKKSVSVCRAMIERNITPENMEEYMKFEDECVKCGFTFKSLLGKLKKAEQDRPDDCDEDGYGDGEQIYNDGRSQGRYEAFGKAIEIVKGGGVDG